MLYVKRFCILLCMGFALHGSYYDRGDLASKEGLSLAGEIETYFRSVEAYIFCNELLQQHESDKAAELGVYLIGANWKTIINKVPYPSESISYEVSHNTNLALGLKSKVIKDTQDKLASL